MSTRVEVVQYLGKKVIRKGGLLFLPLYEGFGVDFPDLLW